MVKDIAEVELAAVENFKQLTDLEVGYAIWLMVTKALNELHTPDAIILGLEATVRALRTASTEKQLAELTVPGVQ